MNAHDRPPPISNTTAKKWVIAMFGAALVVGAFARASPGRADQPLMSAGSPGDRQGIPRAGRIEVPKPACKSEVAAGSSVQAALDTAAAGSVVCLGPGEHIGPLVIKKPITLWGPPDAIVKSTGKGTTLDVDGNDVALLGFTVDGSGGRFDLLDAAVRVQGQDVRVEGLLVRGAVFGLLIEQSKRVRLVGNEVRGKDEPMLGLRGDPIRLWETHDSLIERNYVVAGRDMVVWYSSNNRIIGNRVEDGRYGTHLMFAHDNVVRENRYERDVVGVFLMYSRNVRVEQNRILHSAGAAGIGIGFKESGNVHVVDNVLVHNTIGVFMDTSPLNPQDTNDFTKNVIALGQVGVEFHSSERQNAFVENAFVGNLEQVRVQGNGDALGVRWHGNHFDDYAGYDLDGDGYGDVAYEIRSLSSDLIRRKPELAFLAGTPALWLCDAVSHVAPLFPPRKLLVDDRPRMRSELGHAD